MLKNRDLTEVSTLFDLASHPDVFPFIRQKANTVEDFYFLTEQLIEAERNGELISRTITDENNHPIGTINLFDIYDQSGFLATWIGQPYFGKGYNQQAKQVFLQELFLQHAIETVFMKIKKANTRSLAAAAKIPYITFGNDFYPYVYSQINEAEDVYDLLVITKDDFLAHQQIVVFEPSDLVAQVEIVS